MPSVSDCNYVGFIFPVPSRIFSAAYLAAENLVPQGGLNSTQDASPISANLLGCFSSKLPPIRHPARSASQICRVTQRLVALVDAVRPLFNHQSPHLRLFLRTFYDPGKINRFSISPRNG